MKCDVYVYEHYCDGYVCHVASRKIVNLDDAPECPSWFDFPTDENGRLSDESIQNYLVKHRAWNEWLDKSAIREDIGLEHDGKTFSCDEPGEMAETLMLLKGAGYQVPQYAIDALYEEQSEIDGL
jgi:hypothetical protein